MPVLAPDVVLHRDGSVVVFTAVSPAATQWIRDNVEVAEWQQLGPAAFAVDVRCAHDLAQGMVNEGMRVRG